MKKGLIYALIVFILDQASKTAVLMHFRNSPAPVEVTSFFNLLLAWNKGVSFSMFHSDHPVMPWVLTGIALLICAMIVHWMSMEKNQGTVNCFGLILGGAIGNIFDRIRYGAVVDFLDFHIGTHHWPAFNIGDSAICIGAGIILIWNIFLAPAEKLSDPEKEIKNDSNA